MQYRWIYFAVYTHIFRMMPCHTLADVVSMDAVPVHCFNIDACQYVVIAILKVNLQFAESRVVSDWSGIFCDKVDLLTSCTHCQISY